MRGPDAKVEEKKKKGKKRKKEEREWDFLLYLAILLFVKDTAKFLFSFLFFFFSPT